MVNFNIDKLLKKWLPKIIKAINIDYSVGSAVSITNAKREGKKTIMKPLNLTKKDQEINIEVMTELIKGVNEDLAKKTNYLVNQSITEGWDNKMLAQELEGIFKKDNPNYFNYKNRFKTIARTESSRIMSTAQNNTAIRLGAKKKYLFNTIDNRTGEDSKISQAKYGTEEQAIPVNKPFTYTYAGKKRTFMLPPDRVNDRSTVLYTFE